MSKLIPHIYKDAVSNLEMALVLMHYGTGL